MFKLTKILFWRGRIVGHFNGAREIDIAANFLKNRDIFRPFWSLKNRKNKEIISMKEKEKIQALRFETNWERWVYFCRKRWCNGPKSRLKRPIFRPKYFFFIFGFVRKVETFRPRPNFGDTWANTPIITFDTA